MQIIKYTIIVIVYFFTVFIIAMRNEGYLMYDNNPINNELLNIGLVLNGEKTLEQLFETILYTGMNLASCDGGVICLLEDGMLHYTYLMTRSNKLHLSSLGYSRIPLMPISLSEDNIYTTVMRSSQIVHISNIKNYHEFDISLFKTFDKRIGYHTMSAVIIPLFTNENEPLGILQFMNCTDYRNRIIPFQKELDYALLFFGTQSALAIANLNYTQEIKDLLNSFAASMATAIDERTPYNAKHSHNVAKYARLFMEYYNVQYKEGYVREYFDENRLEQLYLAALLHDIGKLAIPLEIMNKSTRLSSHLDDILERFELIRCYYRIDYLEHQISSFEYNERLAELDYLTQFINKVNTAPYLNDETLAESALLANYSYIKKNGEILPYFTEYELECLKIQKGTLTNEERAIMESHVTVTSKMLSRFKFNSHFENIPRWANHHHEFLDGSGYPDHLTAKDMPLEMRILSICDIYDALLATDRPYKQPMSENNALDILCKMAKEGKLDLSLVLIFSDMIHHKNM